MDNKFWKIFRKSNECEEWEKWNKKDTIFWQYKLTIDNDGFLKSIDKDTLKEETVRWIYSASDKYPLIGVIEFLKNQNREDYKNAIAMSRCGHKIKTKNMVSKLEEFFGKMI